MTIDVNLYEAAAEVQAALTKLGYPFCIIDGVANARWGSPRATRDIDVAVLTGWGDEERVVKELLTCFDPRVPDAADFAKESRVVLGRTSGGVDVDLSLAALDFEKRACERATAWSPVEGIELTTVSAEDLLVLKAFAARPQDWLDVREIIIRQGGALDWQSVLDELGQVAGFKEGVDILGEVERLRSELAEENA